MHHVAIIIVFFSVSGLIFHSFSFSFFFLLNICFNNVHHVLFYFAIDILFIDLLFPVMVP